MPTTFTTEIKQARTIGQEIEIWLEESTETEPTHPLIWTGDRRETTVHGVERLSMLISSIPAPAKLVDGYRYFFGMAQWSDHHQRPRWGETMRLQRGWIVEVSTGSHDSWPLRVFGGPPGATYPSHPVGDSPDPSELWGPLEAAEIIWAWQNHRLPDWCQTTLDYLNVDQRRQYGL